MVQISSLIQVSKIFCVADTRVKTFIHGFHVTFSNLLIQKTCGKEEKGIQTQSCSCYCCLCKCQKVRG